MRIWMSETTGQSDNKYAVRMALGILGCVFLALMIGVMGTVVSIKMEENKELVSLLITLLGTGLVMWCAMRIGKMSVRDTLIFCKDENDALFVINLRDQVKYRRGLGGYIAMAAETERLQTRMNTEGILEQKIKDGSIRDMAVEILSVKKMKEHKDGHSVVCMVKYPRGGNGKASYLVCRGYQQEDELLYHLQRRLQKTVTGEVEKNPYPLRIAISVLALVGMVVLCVLSHPAVAFFSEKIYFPCLGVTCVPLCVLVYYVIKMRCDE